MSNVNIKAMFSPIAAPTRHPMDHKAMSDLADFAAKVVNIFRLRAVDSGRLYSLNGHVLKDIGLNRADIGGGPAESFWLD